MKIDRLLSIIMVLANKRLVQARELAEMFDISVRTVYRDVDAINQAGIPIVSYQGSGGGIGIADGFRMDKNVFTGDEMASVMIALKILASTVHDSKAATVLEKLNKVLPEPESEKLKVQSEQLFVDLSEWGTNPALQDKISRLKEAVGRSQRVSLTYTNAKGERTRRQVEPYTLVLKNHHWYLYAYCLDKQEFRLFKLTRMTDIMPETALFERQPINLDNLPWEHQWNTPENRVRLVLRFRAQMQPLVEEWFGIENVEVWGDDCLVKTDYPDGDWMYGFILSFGKMVEVVEPESVREKIRKMAEDIRGIYV